MERSSAATVAVEPIGIARLEPIVGAERVEQLRASAAEIRRALDGNRILHVNSTAVGGGVAEMLRTLVGYTLGAGLATEWAVIEGDAAFFGITKRLHNGLYGGPGDGGELGAAAHAHYDRITERNVALLRPLVRPGDVVIVHDPQPAGLVRPLGELGARVVWRCHVGHDGGNEWTNRGWHFLRRYVEPADAFVFSRERFAPSWIDRAWLRVIPPSIDPFSPKNRELEPAQIRGLLVAAGLVADAEAPAARIGHPASVVREGPPPAAQDPLVVQVSRWDPMKDMVGVMEGFVRHVQPGDAQLVLAGPAVDGVDDDPEGGQVWRQTVAAWEALPAATRARVHLAAIPMDDLVENALVVNALQRQAAVVVQKSLAEGFGLTVAEAMWKTRPVVASAVGGIVDQVVDGETGLLVDDPRDLEGFGTAIQRLLADPDEADRLGRNARRHVERHFLGDRHLLDYAELVTALLATR